VTATKTATRWTCPRCGTTLTLYITPSIPPTCTNHTGGRATTMKREESQ
jgi:rubrerythrin